MQTFDGETYTYVSNSKQYVCVCVLCPPPPPLPSPSPVTSTTTENDNYKSLVYSVLLFLFLLHGGEYMVHDIYLYMSFLFFMSAQAAACRPSWSRSLVLSTA